MRLLVTIYEATAEGAIEAIRSLEADHDGVELRAEEFGVLDLGAVRAATTKPILLTYRGKRITEAQIRAAIEAGIELVDVEYHADLDVAMLAPYREQIVLSHHDYDGMPDVDALLADMRRFGCAHLKLAATPRTLADNEELLVHASGATVTGMGERGLYSRILAPFLGSEFQFVARDAEHSGAPGQITLERALAIYGDASHRAQLGASKPAIFAVTGNPAGHSLSPSIHNPLFRERALNAAYTIASVESFAEIAEVFAAGRVCGLSITAPFKEDAFAFARETGATIADNASRCGAVNTLVRTGNEVHADNTDVDGFRAILREVCGRDRKSVALLGAGGTARAALVALEHEGMHVTVYNRTVEKAQRIAPRVEPLDALSQFDGEIIVNTLTAGVEVELPLRPGMTYIEAGYGHSRAAVPAGVQHFDGLDLLRAQAIRQNELFAKAVLER